MRLRWSVLAAFISVAVPLRAADMDASAWIAIARKDAATMQEQLSAIVAEEEYLQEVRSLGTGITKRTTRADLLFLHRPQPPFWLAFRDVFEVAGRPVRDREERLTRLFLRTPEGLAKAADLTKESARFNLGHVNRTLNVPTLALWYLIEPQRLAATGANTEHDGDITRVRIAFVERARPTLVRNTNGQDIPARGSVWLSPDTESIERTRLEWSVPGSRMPLQRTAIAPVSVTVAVEYVREPRSGAFVPRRMEEQYVSEGERIACTAVYSNVRRFTVETTETVRQP